MENQVLKFIEKILISPKTKEKLMDFIHEKFNEELYPDKKVEDLLGGEFKFQIEKNLDKILESLENILINSIADATEYAKWIGDVLIKRNEYTCSDRGFPELDLCDVILSDTLFTTGIESTIIANKLKYNGTLSATTTYISNEV